MNKQRLLSLDIFRGATIAAMILVNNPGSWGYVYPPLLHADWHGATVTDWIFPFFIFIVGVAIAYALGKRKRQEIARKVLVRKILVRTAIIFGIGLFLNAFPFFNLSTIRIPGVLQRIALVYGVTALLFLYQSPRQLLYTGIVCLLGYWALLTLVPIPGGGAPSLAPGEDLGAWLDRTLLGDHLWSQSKTWDPEGLLSTVPAFATSISGILTGLWLRQARTDAERVAGLMVAGTLLLGVSLVWDLAFPINKKIWTSSYVLYTSGIAMLLLGTIYYWVDMKGYRAWSKPFVVYGTNALFVFVLSGLVAKTLYTLRWTGSEGKVISAKTWLTQTLFDPLFGSPHQASLAFAIANVLFFWLLSWVLYRRKIFIKV